MSPCLPLGGRGEGAALCCGQRPLTAFEPAWCSYFRRRRRTPSGSPRRQPGRRPPPVPWAVAAPCPLLRLLMSQQGAPYKFDNLEQPEQRSGHRARVDHLDEPWPTGRRRPSLAPTARPSAPAEGFRKCAGHHTHRPMLVRRRYQHPPATASTCVLSPTHGLTLQIPVRPWLTRAREGYVI
jgi:hypothetical protein